MEGKRVLHFAPEAAISRLIKPLASSYVTADISADQADIVLNIEAIDQPAASVDVVICSHVLEHVDDAKAMAEISRILTPQGLAIMLVPVVHNWPDTFEVEGVDSDEERFRLFGQKDHVRRYGADFIDLLMSVFRVETWQPSPFQCLDHGLGNGEKIYLCYQR